MSKRRQFNLRSLMAATLLAAIGFAMLRHAKNEEIHDPRFYGPPLIMGCSFLGAAFAAIVGKLPLWASVGAAIGVAIMFWMMHD
jgi:hypothetical protein